MSLETLSVAANVFQVVSFADAVIRAGTQLYELFAKAQAAAQNIANLLAELQALLRVVANVHILLSEHAASLLSNVDPYTLQTIRTILTLIEHDFRHLKSLIATLAPVKQHTWYGRLTSGFRWAVNEREVETACLRLGRYTTNLTAALSVSGRRNDLILKTEIHEIKLRLDTMPFGQAKPPETSSVLVTGRKRSHVASLHSRPAVRMPICVREKSLRSTVTITSPRDGDQMACRPQGQLLPDHRLAVYEQLDRSLVLDSRTKDVLDIAKPLSSICEHLGAALTTQRPLCLSTAEIEHIQVVLDALQLACHQISMDKILDSHTVRQGDATGPRTSYGSYRQIILRTPESSIKSRLRTDTRLVRQEWQFSSGLGHISGELVQLVTARPEKTSKLAAFRLHVRPRVKSLGSGLQVQYVTQTLKFYMAHPSAMVQLKSDQTPPVVVVQPNASSPCRKISGARLLELCHSTSGVRLVEFVEVSLIPQYLAVSYTWSSAPVDGTMVPFVRPVATSGLESDKVPWSSGPEILCEVNWRCLRLPDTPRGWTYLEDQLKDAENHPGLMDNLACETIGQLAMFLADAFCRVTGDFHDIKRSYAGEALVLTRKIGIYGSAAYTMWYDYLKHECGGLAGTDVTGKLVLRHTSDIYDSLEHLMRHNIHDHDLTSHLFG